MKRAVGGSAEMRVNKEKRCLLTVILKSIIILDQDISPLSKAILVRGPMEEYHFLFLSRMQEYNWETSNLNRRNIYVQPAGWV